MTRASQVSDALLESLETVPGLQSIHMHAESVRDDVRLPVALVNLEGPDTLIQFVGLKAKRERTYSIQVVCARGATEKELNSMAKEILHALEFGEIPARRQRMQGLSNDQQEIHYEFAGNGTNLTTVTLLVTFEYVEDYTHGV